MLDTHHFFDDILLRLLRQPSPRELTITLLHLLETAIALDPQMCARFLRREGLQLLEGLLQLPSSEQATRAQTYTVLSTVLRDCAACDASLVGSASWLPELLLEMLDREGLNAESVVECVDLLITRGQPLPDFFIEEMAERAGLLEELGKRLKGTQAVERVTVWTHQHHSKNIEI